METAGQEHKTGHGRKWGIKSSLWNCLNQQDMNGQSRDFMGIFLVCGGYAGVQLAAMVDELQGVREQLSRIQEDQPKSVTENLMDKVAHYFRGKIHEPVSERLASVGNHLMANSGTDGQRLSGKRESGDVQGSPEGNLQREVHTFRGYKNVWLM